MNPAVDTAPEIVAVIQGVVVGSAVPKVMVYTPVKKVTVFDAETPKLPAMTVPPVCPAETQPVAHGFFAYVVDRLVPFICTSVVALSVPATVIPDVLIVHNVLWIPPFVICLNLNVPPYSTNVMLSPATTL